MLYGPRDKRQLDLECFASVDKEQPQPKDGKTAGKWKNERERGLHGPQQSPEENAGHGPHLYTRNPWPRNTQPARRTTE